MPCGGRDGEGAQRRQVSADRDADETIRGIFGAVVKFDPRTRRWPSLHATGIDDGPHGLRRVGKHEEDRPQF